MFNTPILFLIFNRKDTTEKVFEVIRSQKPRYLFVAADGPRPDKNGEIEKCRETRSVINVDWECELKTLYRDDNLGCRDAVSSAISWFFEQVEYGIILEDDCLPDDSFFRYCEELLYKYKDDDRIGNISGNCFFSGVIDKNNLSYDFSNICHTWGWATWRRVWKNFDINLNCWVQSKKERRSWLFNSFGEKACLTPFIQDAIYSKNNHSAWDIQYFIMLRLYNQLCIYPSVNLVTNIGLNSVDATHTKNDNDKYYIKSETMTFPLKHPECFIRNKSLDKKSNKIFFSYKKVLRYFLKRY